MWLCPSLLRPNNLARLLESYEATGATEPMLVRLWVDDPKREEYMEVAHKAPSSWLFEWVERMTAPEHMQAMYHKYKDVEYYGFVGDDITFMTEGWDEKLREAAGHDKLAYPDDGMHGERLCTHPCIGRDLVRKVGFFGCPGLKHSFVDSVWYVLALNVGALVYVGDVKFMHHHPLLDPQVEVDELYQFAANHFEQDKQRFMQFQEGGELKMIVERFRLVRAKNVGGEEVGTVH